MPECLKAFLSLHGFFMKVKHTKIHARHVDFYSPHEDFSMFHVERNPLIHTLYTYLYTCLSTGKIHEMFMNRAI